MTVLRKFLSIALLAILGLPFVSPLFALNATGDKGVPACCRRNGKHQCIASAGMRVALSQHTPAFSAPAQRCPYRPASMVVVHGASFTVPTAKAVYAGLIAHPAVVAQTESKLRNSGSRSRQKRGPPTLFVL
jgi:hypothetical protein